jgi:hypothetical protein
MHSACSEVLAWRIDTSRHLVDLLPLGGRIGGQLSVILHNVIVVVLPGDVNDALNRIRKAIKLLVEIPKK